MPQEDNINTLAEIKKGNILKNKIDKIRESLWQLYTSY